MTRHIPEDRRFMGHEQRIAEGFMAAPEVPHRDAEKPVTTCFCGKTVTHTFGRRVAIEGAPVECPRECEKERV